MDQKKLHFVFTWHSHTILLSLSHGVVYLSQKLTDFDVAYIIREKELEFVFIVEYFSYRKLIEQY